MEETEPTNEPVTPNHAFSKEYQQVLTDINKDGNCPAPFCLDQAPYHKHPLIFDFVHWKVTRNSYNYQNAEHAFLIVLKRHEVDFMNITREEWECLGFVIRTLVDHFKLKGYTFLWRMGETSHTGASVKHLHAHLICGAPRPNKATADLDDSEVIKAVVGFA